MSLAHRELDIEAGPCWVILMVSRGPLICLQSARPLRLWGLGRWGDGGDLGQMSLLLRQASLGLFIWRMLYSEKEREHRSFETQAQNWHIATTATFSWPERRSLTKPKLPKGWGSGLQPLMGRNTKSPRKEKHGSQICTQPLPHCLPQSAVIRANLIESSP